MSGLEMQGDHPPWAQGILRRNVLFHCCNCLALCTLTVTTAQLIRGYLLHCCNITLCINLYISPISERAELNLHVSGFLARKKSVLSFLRTNWSPLGEILNVLVSFWTMGQQDDIFESKTRGRMPQEKPGKDWLQSTEMSMSSSN